MIDEPKDVKAGEALDAEKLQTYLRGHFPELDSPIDIKQFPGGHSNLTYMLTIGDKEYVLRRPPFGKKIKSAHDMGREFRILSHLDGVYDKIPKPLIHCEDESVLGAPFYIMERLKGTILRASQPKEIDLTSDVMQQLSENFIDNLVELHQLDYEAAGLGEYGRPQGYIKRQIEGWTKRYANAKTDDIDDIDVVAKWLANNMPDEVSPALIHNDYKYDNLVLNPNDLAEIIGVLDWEMATIGDPLMDLGTSLAYWVDANDPPELQSLAFGLTALHGNLGRRGLVERYAQKSEYDVKDGLYYYIYGLFKVIVIAQQIYARYKAGFSKDERFAMFIFAVKIMAQTAVLAIQKKRIDNLTN